MFLSQNRQDNMSIYQDYCDNNQLSGLIYNENNNFSSIELLTDYCVVDSLNDQIAYPAEVIAITDFGCDHDDELAFVVSRALEKLGLIKIIGVVVNHSSDDKRAKLVKSALNYLGFDQTLPVARGSDDAPKSKPKSYEFKAAYMNDAVQIEADGQILIKDLCEKAVTKNKKVNLVLLSGMTDARNFIKNNLELAEKSIAKVSIMGGIKVIKGKAVLNDQKHIIPSGVYNNAVGTSSNIPSVSVEAIELYKILQELKIPITITTREAAYEAHITPEFYDKLAEIPSDVTARLQSGQKKAIEEVIWNFFLHERGIEMFWEKFTDGKPETLEKLKLLPENPPYPEGKSPYQFVNKLIPYDPLTIMASFIPESTNLFIPQKLNNQLEIIGIDKHNTGIVNAKTLVSLLYALARFGISKEKDFQEYLLNMSGKI